MRHTKLAAFGLNCALGATHLVPFVERLAKIVECFTLVYSNAGLPDAMGGGYDDTPEKWTVFQLCRSLQRLL